MRSLVRRALAVTAVVTLAAATAQSAGAAVGSGDPAAPRAAATARSDNHPGPQTEKQVALRKAAIKKVSQHKAKATSDGVVQLGPETFAETATVKTDTIFTILGEFGDRATPDLGTAPGPQHNEIAEPDRAADNSTIWAPDFSPAYFHNLFNGDGESMRTYYEDLSSGAYSVNNVVSDWVEVPGNASSYGDNTRENSGGAWDFVADTGNAWWDAQLAAGKTPAEIDAYLAQFDVWDRYDFDGDGNFDEPDGYIDHFQAVHAGQGEESGGGAQGADAIWSHRWYVNGTDFGSTGPQVADAANLSGGARIGASKYWLGDYTTEPENGGLGVFSHEFGHDLGLPDFYDTAGGDNSTAFWTLMSAGSYLNHGGEGIGTTPGLMGPEEKLFLGWLDHSTVALGRSGAFTLNPSQNQQAGKDQAVRVDLPEKVTTTSYTRPPSGRRAWWTGSADGLNETLGRTVRAAKKVTVTATAWYEIEEGYDFLYGEYTLDGVTWKPAGASLGGSSGGKWKAVAFSYPAGGKASQFRFRYQTDGGVHLGGAFVDDITIKADARVVLKDSVEKGANRWAATGSWRISTGSVTKRTEQYYLVENREYVGWDATLRTGPYQFPKAFTAPSWVERFPFQNGMLVWYVDDAFEDNNTSAHPGGGAALVVDARPAPFTYDDGSMPGNRRQTFDATFGLEATDRVCLHKEVGAAQAVVTKEACAPSGPGLGVFDDSLAGAYYSTLDPLNSVKVAGHGVRVTVTGDTGDDLAITVVNPM